MADPERPVEEPRETYSFTLPPRVATDLAIFAAETRQNKSRALEEVIEVGLVVARERRASRKERAA